VGTHRPCLCCHKPILHRNDRAKYCSGQCREEFNNTAKRNNRRKARLERSLDRSYESRELVSYEKK
jgi:predicted nucleic acid-binding Zn ribbon protein